MRDGWIETTLGDICKDGLFVDGDWVESKDQDPQGDYRLLQLADIGDGAFLDKSDRWMNREQFQRLGCTKLEVNDVLIARMPDPIGRACLLPEGLPSSATVVDVAIVRTGNEILQRILSLIVNSPDFRNEAFSLLTGTTRQRISRGNLSKISFWLPSLPEQKRIVDLISSVDSYIEALQHQLESAKRSRNAVLHELLTAGSDDWVETTLGEITDLVRGPFGGSLKKEIFVQEGFAVYEQQHAIYGDFSTIRYRISREKFDEMKRFSLVPGDLIMSCSGTMGKVRIVPKEADPGIINQALLKIKPKSNLSSDFLYLCMQSDDFIRQIEMNSGGGALQNVSSVKMLKGIKLRVPGLLEQERVIGIISMIDEVIIKTELAICEAKNLRSGLLSDLLSGKHEIPASYDKVIGAA